MCGDNDLKFNTLNFNEDFSGFPRDFIAAKDPREMAVHLSSFVVVSDDGFITQKVS
jgi:hypothetical protein